MEDLGIPTRSDTYKIALKHYYKQAKHARMELVWRRQIIRGYPNEEPKPLRPIYLAIEEARQKHKDRTIDESLINAIEDYFKKKK